MQKHFSPLSHQVLAAITNQTREWNITHLREPFGGIRYKFVFSNRYSVTIVKLPGLPGSEDDLWELGIHKNDKFCSDASGCPLTYGHLTDSEVARLCELISDLRK